MKKSVLSLVLLVGLVISFAGPVFAEDGKALFESKCAMCHGKDGVAKPMAKGSANFNDPAWQKANDVAAIEKMVTNGKDKMPKYEGKLKPEEIKAIAEYVKTIK